MNSLAVHYKSFNRIFCPRKKKYLVFCGSLSLFLLETVGHKRARGMMGKFLAK
jgi:hypothetical protein